MRQKAGICDVMKAMTGSNPSFLARVRFRDDRVAQAMVILGERVTFIFARDASCLGCGARWGSENGMLLNLVRGGRKGRRTAILVCNQCFEKCFKESDAATDD